MESLPASDSFMAGLSRYYNTADLSDVTICLVDERLDVLHELKAHRIILCSHSKWFMNAFDIRYKEALSPIIDIRDDDTESFKAMLEYFYTSDYDVQTGTPECTQDTQISKATKIEEESYSLSLLFHIRIYAMADRYEVPSLQALAADKFREVAKKSWHTAGFLEAIEELYTLTLESDGRMGRTIATIVHQHRDRLMESERMKQLIRHFPTFGHDLMLEMRRQWQSSCRGGTLVMCTKCKQFVVWSPDSYSRAICFKCGIAFNGRSAKTTSQAKAPHRPRSISTW